MSRQQVLAGQGVSAHVTPCRACVQLQRIRRPHHSKHATSASFSCRVSAMPCCSAANLQKASTSKKAPSADHKQQPEGKQPLSTAKQLCAPHLPMFTDAFFGMCAEACMTRRQTLQTLAAAALAVALPQNEVLAAEDVQVSMCLKAIACLAASTVTSTYISPCLCLANLHVLPNAVQDTELPHPSLRVSVPGQHRIWQKATSHHIQKA
jgi:hypothetical protein